MPGARGSDGAFWHCGVVRWLSPGLNDCISGLAGRQTLCMRCMRQLPGRELRPGRRWRDGAGHAHLCHEETKKIVKLGRRESMHAIKDVSTANTRLEASYCYSYI